MPVVPLESRVDEMKRLGFSEPLIKIATGRGDEVHAVFGIFQPSGPEEFALYGEDSIYPEGPPLLHLWEYWGCIQVAAWVKEGELEFIEYLSGEWKYRVIARTEQGLFSYMIFTLCVNERLGWEDCDGPVAALGFRYFGVLKAAWTTDKKKYARQKYEEDKRDAIAAEIDKLAERDGLA